MLSKRVVAIAADKAFGRRLAAGLMAAGGMVEAVASLDDLARGEIAASLVVVHVPEGADTLIPAVAARLKRDAWIVAIIPTSSLATTVKVMQQSARVASVLVADELDPGVLSSVASRLLYGDVFGLEKAVRWGVRVYSILVGDYQEKSVAISAVSDFAGAMGVRRKYRESIEQCLDELLMNALYDAPVDTTGRQMFAEVPTKTRISLRMEQKAVVQYACDGSRFAVSVRDSFGMLKKEIVVRYLDKCLHAEEQIDRKMGGAGLGLYIVTNAASEFLLNVYPGVATEAVCTFDLTAPKVQIKTFGVFEERIDSSGRLVAGPSRLTPSAPSIPGPAAPPPPAAPPSRGLVIALSAALTLILALIAVIAYPRLAEPRTAIAVTTDPPGANVELDGRAVGSTSRGPLSLEGLRIGQGYRITARLDGYEPADELVSAARGATAPVRLTLRPKAATVAIETDPAGAAVVLEGKEIGFTPLTLTRLTPGAEVPITLRRSGYDEVTRTVRVPRPGGESREVVALVVSPDFGTLDLDSEPPGAQIYLNDQLLAGVVTPAHDYLVQGGATYTVTLKVPGYMPESRTVTVARGARDVEVKARLRPGSSISVLVEHLDGAAVTVEKVPACTDRRAPLVNCPVADGRYKVRVSSRRPFLDASREVEVARADRTVTFSLGFVEGARPDIAIDHRGAPRHTRRIAAVEGEHNLRVIDETTGEAVAKTVRVTAGKTVQVGVP